VVAEPDGWEEDQAGAAVRDHERDLSPGRYLLRRYAGAVTLYHAHDRRGWAPAIIRLGQREPIRARQARALSRDRNPGGPTAVPLSRDCLRII